MRRIASFFTFVFIYAAIFGQQTQNGNTTNWYADGDEILYSPVSGLQTVALTSVEADQYIITTDVKWRAGQMQSGDYADIRVDVKNISDQLKYRFRLHDPQYEPANQSSSAREATFAIEKQITTGRTGTDEGSWETVVSATVKPGQIDKADTWHNLFITVSGKNISVKWDDATILTFSGMESTAAKNNITFGTHSTAAQYKNIQVSSIDRFLVYMSGIPETVAIPK
ncbi:MAG: alpha-L-arabinofuranosidase domain protein [Bacteroidetes bacterium]|nr:alpha-L-arabinofuranosidase domain protein [Bacteroidota bacterium]